MDKNVKYFIKDNYKILSIMAENEVTILNKRIVPLSQDTIAKISGFSKAKVNEIVNDLIDRKYIVYKAKGKYQLTKDAIEVYRKIENILK